MKLLIRNFFYAIGATLLLYTYTLNAATATFADLVRVIQSHDARVTVVLFTLILMAMDFFSGPSFVTVVRATRLESRETVAPVKRPVHVQD